jgi:hypothetical protein
MPSASVKQRFGRTYTDEFNRAHGIKIFRVDTAGTPYTDLDLILGVFGVPALGEVYSSGVPNLICTSRTVKEVGTPLSLYDVECEYDIRNYLTWDVKITGQGKESVLEQTLADSAGVGLPPRFTAKPGQYLYSSPSGLAGEWVMNRADDKFDPPIMFERRLSLITANIIVPDTTYLGFQSVGELRNLEGKVNGERVTLFSFPDNSQAIGCQYWTLLMQDVDVEKLPKPAGGCDLQVTYRILYDPMGHCQVVLNSGFNQILGTGEKVPVYTSDQVNSNTPLPLDNNGLVIPAASLPAALTYIFFPDHETYDFNKLNLPKTFGGAYVAP